MKIFCMKNCMICWWFIWIHRAVSHRWQLAKVTKKDSWDSTQYLISILRISLTQMTVHLTHLWSTNHWLLRSLISFPQVWKLIFDRQQNFWLPPTNVSFNKKWRNYACKRLKIIYRQMIWLWDINITDLDGYLTPNEPNTPKKQNW